MSRNKPIFYSALLLTAVNLLLRIVGTTFHVYLSRRIGAAGIGLLQLVMSVGSLTMVAGIAGIRTASMYLTAGELGRGRPENTAHVLSACSLYSILCSSIAAGLLYLLAPLLAEHWIGNRAVVPSLRLFAAFLPIVCLCGVLSGYFTAAKRIGTLAAVQVAEQLCSILVTFLALTKWAGRSPERACMSVIFGSSIGSCLTLLLLILLRTIEHPSRGSRFPIRRRLLQTALPLAAADLLRSGISTTEHLMVPKRLALHRKTADPMSAFGQISGMVFPVMMFPACILFALAELLIPELAGCCAASNHERIHYLVRKSLWVAMLYGSFFGGLLFLLAEPLCIRLYRSPEAGRYLRLYSLMVPFLYCDAITDAMTKGLGQQKVCVRYNILTSSMDVLFLFLLLPRCGMVGYFISFLVTHLLNFLLSLRRLLLITGLRLAWHIPLHTATASILAAYLSFRYHALLYVPIWLLLLCLFKVLQKQDLHWLLCLFRRPFHAEQPIPA